MSTPGVLDDYLEELLGDAIAVAPTAPVEPDAPAPAFDTPTSPGAPANLALLDELMNDPALGPITAFDTPTSPGAQANLALLDELMNDPALGPVVDVEPGLARLASEDDRPDWNDLPDEALHDTPVVAAPVAAPPPAPAKPAPAPLPPRAAPTPTARAAPILPANAPNPARPGSWQELQAQALNPASSPREHRRANERTSRWLRMRCGSQAYALELLKVQEVVLPVPLLPLRGTPAAMLGIMNLRGQVVPVMDLGTHLGAGPAVDDANTRIVVLEENGETMGLRVSAVEDVANLTDSQIEPPDTARICQISNDLFRGVARISAQPMILLDATQLLN
ncbi:chemotaxis protein CheW [Stenotrophomonas oahuensis]|uniref:Chemotaxis protein CheW n=2 Tax=Stenotrophomonas TaxID=40323 RepID=A0ABY9YNW0_9GAMM|nr:chemotaxis protein CheW [Stenotrophomonas sp. A5586]WNH51908.1 chemotaxis protein CheW [Stenotrophomonas sp. A5586]